MDKNGNELLKQAISEGLSLRFQDEIDGCTEEIVCSRRHKRAMAAILRGDKADGKLLSPKLRKIIAILVAALLVLASCAVVYKIGVRDIVESVKEFFIGLTYSEDEPEGSTIDEVYELTYIPEGYVLEKRNITNTVARTVFSDLYDNKIFFEQRTVDNTNFFVDSDDGFSLILENNGYKIYYRNSNNLHHYTWNNGKEAFKISANNEITEDELILIIKGMKTN